MGRRAAFFSLLLATLSCQRACGPRAGDEPGGLVLGMIGEPDTLDPAFARVSSGQELTQLAFRDLTAFDDHWQLVPMLAERLPTVETSSSGRPRVRWTLREGLSWSDGAPLDTQDLLFAWSIEKDPALPAVSHQVAIQVAAMIARSPRELDVEWSAPVAEYRAPRVHAILPRHAYPKPQPGEPFRGLGSSPVGSGPFRVSAWEKGQSLSLVARESWLGQRPGLDRIMVRFYAGEDSLEAAVLAGDVDALPGASGLALERVVALGERMQKSHVLELTEGGSLLHLQLRLDHPLLAKLEVRRAISQAIDRARIVAVCYGGHGSPAGGVLPPRHPAAKPDRPPLAFDPNGAKPVLPPDSKLELGYAAGNQSAERAALLIQSQLAAIGLALELLPLPFAVLNERLEQRSQPALVLYALRVRPDWDGRSLFAHDGRQNAMGYQSAEVDRLLSEARSTLEPAAWAERVGKVEDAVLAELPIIPIAFRQEASLRPRRLSGWRPTGVSPVTWNAEAWRLEPAGETEKGP